MKTVLSMPALLVLSAHAVAFAAQPSFTFAESSSQKVVRYSCTSPGNYSITTRGHGGGRFTARLPLGNTDPAQFSFFTPVEVRIGDFQMAGMLGNDPQFFPGRNTATLMFGPGPFPDPVTDRADAAAGFRVTWNGATLTVQGLSGDLDSFSIAAKGLFEESGPIDTMVSAYVRLGDFEFERTLYVGGVSKPNILDLCGTPFVIENIRVTGKADYVRPTVRLAKPTITGQTAQLSGTARDNVEVAQVFVQVNGGPWEMAAGTTQWTASVSSLVAGQNTVAVRGVDLDGNESRPVTRRIVAQSN